MSIYSMKNKKLLVAAAIIVGLMLLALILEKTHVINLYHKTPTSSQNGPTPEQKQQESQTNADAKKEVIEKGNSDPSVTNPAKSIDLSARQEANNTVTVFTKLPGYSSGSCDLTVSNGAKTSTQSVQLLFQPEFSTCAGFSVPIGPLGKGTWNIKLAVTSGGSTESKSISYEVK